MLTFHQSVPFCPKIVLAGQIKHKVFKSVANQMFTMRGGILVLGTAYHGANIYSVGYNSINVIYEHPSQKWLESGALSISGYGVTFAGESYIHIFSTDQDS